MDPLVFRESAVGTQPSVHQLTFSHLEKNSPLFPQLKRVRMILTALAETCCYPLALVGPGCCVVAPAMAYVTAAQYSSGNDISLKRNIAILCVTTTEALFFIWFRKALREAQARHLPIKSTERRRREIWNGVRACDKGKLEPYQYLRHYFSPFPLEKLGLGDIKSLYAESMFNCLLSELTENDLLEIDSYITVIEKDLGFTFPEQTCGVLPDLMRLHYDPVKALSKPCLYYAVVNLVDIFSDVFLVYLGFKRYRQGGITYWLLRPQFSSSTHFQKDPVFFVHGVGVGLSIYTLFIARIVSSLSHHPIILLELPHVSMKLYVDIIPSMKDIADATETILNTHQFLQAHFVVHSLGSFVFGAINYLHPSIVASVILIDPVCFKLWEPHVMHNFLYRIPKSPVQVLMKHLVTWELTISHYFHRHFFWTDCVLFRESVPQSTYVILSEEDEIVDSLDLYQYLKESDYIKVQILHGGHHGEWTMNKTGLSTVVNALSTMVRGSR